MIRKIFQHLFTTIFTLLARLALYRHQPTIVAVTGNVGKTTTKDVILALLQTQRQVRGTIRSQNSDLTTPLSILGLEVHSRERRPRVWLSLLQQALHIAFFSRSFPEILVLEIGLGQPGDITRQARWIQPHLSVFTALQTHPTHLEFFTSREQLFEEKKQLARHTRPGGTIIYNREDNFLHDLLHDCPQHTLTIGTGGEITFSSLVNNHVGVQSQMSVRGVEHLACLEGVWGSPYMTSYAFGVAVALDLGLDISECFERVHHYFRPNPGRMRILKGTGGSLIIDDSYNASPQSVQAALETLKGIARPGRKIFLFGDMKELGTHTGVAHREIGAQATRVVDMIICVGDLTRLTADEMLRQGFPPEMIFEIPCSQEAGAFVSSILHSGDIVLAKSSRHAIQMERALIQLVIPEEIPNLVQEYLKEE